MKTLGFLPLAALVFSLSSTPTYTWSLVTIQLIPNVAVLMVLLVFDRSLRDTGTGRLLAGCLDGDLSRRVR